MAEAAGSASRTPFSTAKRLERARELLRALAVSQTNAALYPPTHPTVAQSVSELVSAVDGLRDLGFGEVTVNIYKNTIFVEDQVFPEESVTYKKLVEELLRAGVSALIVREGASQTDAMALTELLGDESVKDIQAARALLADRGANAISVEETVTLADSAKEQLGREARAKAMASYEQGVELMEDVETQAKLGKVFEVEPLQNLVSELLDNLLKDPAAVLGLTAIKDHDNYTLNHSINVCILALALGASIGLADEDSLRSLGLSALLYDLGKVRIPEEILNKQEPLTADEWEIIKSHTAEGADLLKRIQLVDQMPMVVAFEHHQRHDRQGYPGTSGQEQHLFSKIVAVCDAYDAMTTRRPFRQEIRPDKALAVIMQGRGKAYDPSITKALVALVGIYPMGATVRLDDGSTAVVYRVNRDDLLRPRVKLLVDADGRWLEEPETVDLRVIDPDSGEHPLSIDECIPSVEAGIDDVWEYL
jgi:HD-GYP domain-containing protein (c-di-GMP phosphodiesterase class II)